MTVNVDNINKVIELIRKEEVAKFDMRNYKSIAFDHPCKTAGCIAGFASMAAGYDILDLHDNSIIKVAREFIGIDWRTANKLFHANDGDYRVRLKEFRGRDAIKSLEHLRDSGEVDMSIFPHAVRM